MDKLDEIFYLQYRFDQDLARRRNLDYDMSTWVQKGILALVSEMAELLDEVNFKWWKNAKPVDVEAIHEELADILHFYVSLCLKVGLDAPGLHKAYVAKNRENFLRQQGLSDRAGYES
jgi:dimeric dUTPase (all-alpha-NTP-PPase superfamily)